MTNCLVWYYITIGQEVKLSKEVVSAYARREENTKAGKTRVYQQS